ncbi:LytR/AlgR family response regulator transcription factor [Plebeiibacterium marinum]|uniref:LytTR family DNA-binding domain-containing protein n=1 Tax=Plebeiibacterium marinum TaxID=2992111 RepID=A0AAE3SKE3_9BACT|nr:LytTR family DNA-binding domain-containing protein [Plebeiobacterium marinum]MCW3806750.1 LytTR family DNA-binding domain-containing protein [Plebeiobacterium marinum]
MENISILIADVDIRIRTAIEKILVENFGNIKIIAQTDTVEDTIKALYFHKPQIALLDIHLFGGTAIEVVRQTFDLDYKVIFMSAYQEYALDDIRFASIDFIYKPLDISELLIVVDNVITSLVEEGYKKKMQAFFENTSNPNNPKHIVFKTKSQIFSVAISNIVFGESNYSKSDFTLKTGKLINTKEPLRRYESMLQHYGFIRCHPRYIVNINHIKDVNYNTLCLMLTNNNKIPFEEKRLASIKPLTTNYMENTQEYRSYKNHY